MSAGGVCVRMSSPDDVTSWFGTRGKLKIPHTDKLPKISRDRISVAEDVGKLEGSLLYHPLNIWVVPKLTSQGLTLARASDVARIVDSRISSNFIMQRKTSPRFERGSPTSRIFHDNKSAHLTYFRYAR